MKPLLLRAFKAIKPGWLVPKQFTQLLARYARFLPLEPGPSGAFRILEVGPGSAGQLGRRFEANRLDVVSLNKPPHECLAALQGLQAESFDMVLARDLVSHLEDPGGVIARLLELIRPTCSVFIEEPITTNAASAGGADALIEVVDDDIRLTGGKTPFSIAGNVDKVIICHSRHRADAASLRLQKPGMNQREINWNWERGKHETMVFWSGIVNNLTPDHQFNNRLDPDRPLIPKVAQWINTPRDTIKVLDVGCGPATNLGHKISNKTVEMTCVDLMAREFNELTSAAGLKIPCPPIYGTAEKVGEQFPAGHFDLVFSRNALDHVYDPFTALKGMMQVCRDDGIVVVWGHMNEGVTQNYRNFHQWNFCWQDEDFIIWRPDRRQSIRELFDGKVYLKQQNEKHKEHDLYRIIMSKSPIKGRDDKLKVNA